MGLVFNRQESKSDDGIREKSSSKRVGLVWNQHKFQPDDEIRRNHPWHWNGISTNLNLMIKEFVERHSQNAWDWLRISGNPTLMMEYVENHPDK